MEKDRHIIVEKMDWQGYILSVSYEPNWLSMERPCELQVAHLQVDVVGLDLTPLPITETGYKSRFLHPNHVEEAGGPVAYVRAWLDHAARSPAWKRRRHHPAQLSLFD